MNSLASMCCSHFKKKKKRLFPHFEMHEICDHELGTDSFELSRVGDAFFFGCKNATRDAGDSRDGMCDIRVN